MGIKGTVLEVRDKRATVMTEQCEFKEVRLKKPAFPGEEIEFFPADVCGGEYWLNKPLGRIIAAAACFVLVFFLGFAAYRYLLPTAAYAYVGLDVNPSLELTVNKDYRITGGKAFDPEGEAVLQEADINGQEISRAFSEIVELCNEKGYLQTEGVNYIAVSVCMAAPSWFAGGQTARDSADKAAPLAAKETAEEVFIEKVTSSLQAVLEEGNVPAQLYALSVDPLVRKEAQRRQLSPARYFIWQESERAGFSMDLEEAKKLKGERLGKAAERVAAKVLTTREKKGRDVDAPVKGGVDGGAERGERGNMGHGGLGGKKPQDAGAGKGKETGRAREAGRAEGREKK